MFQVFIALIVILTFAPNGFAHEMETQNINSDRKSINVPQHDNRIYAIKLNNGEFDWLIYGSCENCGSSNYTHGVLIPVLGTYGSRACARFYPAFTCSHCQLGWLPSNPSALFPVGPLLPSINGQHKITKYKSAQVLVASNKIGIQLDCDDLLFPQQRSDELVLEKWDTFGIPKIEKGQTLLKADYQSLDDGLPFPKNEISFKEGLYNPFRTNPPRISGYPLRNYWRLEAYDSNSWLLGQLKGIRQVEKFLDYPLKVFEPVSHFHTRMGTSASHVRLYKLNVDTSELELFP